LKGIYVSKGLSFNNNPGAVEIGHRSKILNGVMSQVVALKGYTSDQG